MKSIVVPGFPTALSASPDFPTLFLQLIHQLIPIDRWKRGLLIEAALAAMPVMAEMWRAPFES